MNDVFLCFGKRTPIGRHAGALAMLRPGVAAQVIDAVLAGADLPIDEVIFGCANQAGEDNRNVARMAVLLSRLPQSVPALTVNRLCASGLDAVILGARAIACGGVDLVIAGGVESMSRAPFVIAKAETGFDRHPRMFDTSLGWRFPNPQIAARHGLESMAETAENLAAEQAISRADQDACAWRSQARYDAVWQARDIAPVTIADRKGGAVVVAADEHPRATTIERLAALPTPFRVGGSVTAGNASGINDGAAAVLLASGAAVGRHGLTPLARIGASASAGVAPRLMGTGPIAAVARLCAQTGLAVADFEVIEVNEAFAAQVLACTRARGLADDAAHVNPTAVPLRWGIRWACRAPASPFRPRANCTRPVPGTRWRRFALAPGKG